MAARATNPFIEVKETQTYEKAKSRKALAVNCTDMLGGLYEKPFKSSDSNGFNLLHMSD